MPPFPLIIFAFSVFLAIPGIRSLHFASHFDFTCLFSFYEVQLFCISLFIINYIKYDAEHLLKERDNEFLYSYSCL